MQWVSEDLRSHIFLYGQMNPHHHADHAYPCPFGSTINTSPPPTQPHKFWIHYHRSQLVQGLLPENFPPHPHPPCQAGLGALFTLPFTLCISFYFWSSCKDMFVFWFFREKYWCENERHLIASRMLPHQGPNLQPIYVPCPGISPSTFGCIGQCSNQLSQ